MPELGEKSNLPRACAPVRPNHYGIIDTHAHLTFPEFEKDRREVIARAFEAGLEYIVTIGAGEGLAGNQKAIALAEEYDQIYATVGVHPHDVDAMDDSWLGEIEQMARHPKVVAVGEIGLDFYRSKSSRDVQMKRFRQLLKLANDVDHPVVIHSREACDEIWEVFLEDGIPKRGGVFHCFSCSVEFAQKITKAGFKISIPGVVTFKNAMELQEVVAETPLEKIILETDCPYLAPEPHRGHRNEPAYIRHIVEMIADIKQLSFSDVARITSLTAKRLFDLPGSELMPQIAYQIRNSLYLNITNKCTLGCIFCPKYTDYEVKGYYLRLPHEPNVEEIFQAIGQPENYDEVVFCGYGEPTKRIEVLKVIATRMKEQGVKRIRLNTDGLANLIYGRNVAAELQGLIDAISISLNAPDAKTYAHICPSVYGERAYSEVVNFVEECKRYIPEVGVTAVALPDLALEGVRRIADELSVPLRVREYMNVG
jgi:TatD DNase family protein